ncbi:Rok-like winged helix domain-containing protein [Bacillus atrophaeus]|uniref:Rok-like winged helix domain-containing protein n=1 Tax=Bacillus atrophaeus TaxID=1452 RepID=UPI00227FFF34|nr:hypothetical protein [Bacillus atrophaeus]MCY8825967.1 hypothetical protein [Bacillus atrophaeus]MCY8840339.1 hypothetical protein [Bacillus atrophaeus]MEC0803488.1 hypothetical protein [Bacillus atrophaeus]MEC0854317.1 hypothetical protein [Bacillus atrophaeus]MEC0857519.1 hypothetical protein [Bacillus atrophaeus]
MKELLINKNVSIQTNKIFFRRIRKKIFALEFQIRISDYDFKKFVHSHRSYKLKQREAAIEILESHPEGVKSVDLKRHVEGEVGEEITNMTTFMQTLMNKVPGIVKVSRGFYQYNSK